MYDDCVVLTDAESLLIGDCDTLAEPDELSETLEELLVLTDEDAKPDGVRYELGVGCSELLIVEVNAGDFDGSGVGVSEYIVDTDATGDEDTDAEPLFELVELDESKEDNDAETVLEADIVVELVNLVVIEK